MVSLDEDYLSIVCRYLDTVGCANEILEHTTPFSLDFVPTADDNSVDEAAVKILSSEFNLDFASCFGALIYLALSHVDILHAVNKMAKYTRRPGRNHLKALVHVLRYFREHVHLGITFYSDVDRTPIHLMLLNSQSVPELAKELFLTFSESSCNDDVDTGCSTGSYLISYMGAIVDHSSNMPDPVALSSAEDEYNEAFLACMAVTHLAKLLIELEQVHLMLLNSQSVPELAKELFLTFSESSCNDDVDTGCSTGSYLISYMGAIVDHSSNMPDPVALSSAEDEYNEACLACMAITHLPKLLIELEEVKKPHWKIPLILDSKSAITMGNSFRDTKHTPHILCHYHYVCESVDAGKFQMFWIKTNDELADIEMKQTPGPIGILRVSDVIKSKLSCRC